MSDNNNEKVVSLPSKKIKEGSNVKLKAGNGPTMTVAAIRTLYLCTYFDLNSGEYMDHEFKEVELELDDRKN